MKTQSYRAFIRFLFLFLIIFFVTSAPANSSSYSAYDMGVFRDGAEVYLAADKVNIRDAPVLTGKVVATLAAGSMINIVKQTDQTHTIDSIKDYWYEVKFQHQGKTLTGYTWGGFISIVSIKLGDKGDILFTLRLKKGPTAEAALIQNGKQISTLSFNPHNFDFIDKYGYSVSGKKTGPRGFKEFKEWIALEFNYPACGYPNGEKWLIFDGRSLMFGVESMKVSEAGVFRVDQQLIFPDEKNGKPGTIIRIETQYEFDDAKRDYKTVSEKTENLKWDGRKFATP